MNVCFLQLPKLKKSGSGRMMRTTMSETTTSLEKFSLRCWKWIRNNFSCTWRDVHQHSLRDSVEISWEASTSESKAFKWHNLLSGGYCLHEPPLWNYANFCRLLWGWKEGLKNEPRQSDNLSFLFAVYFHLCPKDEKNCWMETCKEQSLKEKNYLFKHFMLRKHFMKTSSEFKN